MCHSEHSEESNERPLAIAQGDNRPVLKPDDAEFARQSSVWQGGVDDAYSPDCTLGDADEVRRKLGTSNA